eukprot:gene384-252_t
MCSSVGSPMANCEGGQCAGFLPCLFQASPRRLLPSSLVSRIRAVLTGYSAVEAPIEPCCYGYALSQSESGPGGSDAYLVGAGEGWRNRRPGVQVAVLPGRSKAKVISNYRLPVTHATWS